MRWVAGIVALALVAGCSAGTPGTGRQTAAEAGMIELPPPATSGTASLEEALAARRSVRDFTPDPMPRVELSQLLWAAQGVTSSGGKRTAPSAGALYPLEIYVADRTGTYHYLPEGHALEEIGDDDLRPALADAALGQAAVGGAAAVFVVAAVPSRTEAKYGQRADRYVKLEAGHAAQNLLLQAVVLELGAVPIGAFGDQEIQRLLDLPVDVEPLYLIAVGRPATAP